MSLRLAFMGTPSFAVPTLEALHAAGHDVVAVYTRPPATAGRGLRERVSPVQAEAARLGLPVRTPRTLRDPDAAAALAELRPDLAVVVAYGLILPPAVLAVPPRGCLNLHASLLPRWRGAAPIQRAVMAGDPETGVAVMRMEEGLDTGPVATTARISIERDETGGELHDRLAALGARLMADALARLEAGDLAFTAQAEEGVTYAGKIGSDACRIAWDAPAERVHDQVRALAPSPGAFTEIDLGRGPERLKVLGSVLAEGEGAPGTLLGGERVACGRGAVRLLRLQPAGRGAMSGAEFLRGRRLAPGAVFG